jgi:hypothetical protein
MSAIAATRTWLRRMIAAVPTAWHYDPVFRWAAIGAGVAFVLFAVRVVEPLALHRPLFAPRSSAPVMLGPTYDDSVTGAPPVSPASPTIAPGRPLDGATITPAPDQDRFGTAPITSHK